MLQLIGVPSESGSLGKNAGCQQAPQAIAQGLGKPMRTIPVFEWDIEKNQAGVFKSARTLLAKRNRSLPVFLGGDHSITYSLFKAFAQKNRDAGLLVLDAHADCATFFKPVSHEDLNRVLVEEKVLKPSRLLLLGTRKVWPVEKRFLKRKRIRAIGTTTIQRRPVRTEKELAAFLDSVSKIYVSIDIDVLDPVLAPGTGYPEKNGLAKKAFFGLLERILQSRQVQAVDLVEINPVMKGGKKTVRLACSIVRFLEKNWAK